MDIRDFQRLVLEKAKEAGFSDCEIYYRKDESFQAAVSGGEIEHYETSATAGASFRGVTDGRPGYSYTERFDSEAADFIVKSAAENAGISERENMILYGGGDCAGANLYNKELDNVTADEKLSLLKKTEECALGYSPKVRAADRCVFGDERTTVSIMNTRGLDCSYSANGAVAYISVICAEGEDVKTGGEFFAGNDLSLFDPKALGESAAEQAEGMLGAKTVKSGAYRVVFKNTAMADILGTFSGAFTGEQVCKGLSMLEGKEGQEIAGAKVSIRDDALLEGGPASAVFDGEGVPCKNKAVVENGVLKTLLYDLKYAAKCGKESTGNGFRSGYRSQVFCAPSNFYIVPSEKSVENVIADAKEGLYITDVEGLHAGANTVSGDFSLSAMGYRIENGRLGAPVEQITVAANFFELLKNIEDVASDLRFNMGGSGSPAVTVKNISVSGS